jgi:FMN-dependent NADH-azoreductase
MELLHLVATPRTNGSNTLRISEAFIECLKGKLPELKVTTLDLFNTDIPIMAGDKIEAKYIIMRGGTLQQNMKITWTEIESLIAGFQRADMYLVSAPMWNLSIPYVLKYYIDTIIQPGYLFKYLPNGMPVGLGHGKMVVVKTSGGDYSRPPMCHYDFHEPYLRGIFGFCGIQDIHFISAYCMDMNPELREQSIHCAIYEQIPALVERI